MKKHIPLNEIIKIDWRRAKFAIAGVIIAIIILVFMVINHFKLIEKILE